MTYNDPWGDNEFVVDGWCECAAGVGGAHRHLGKSPWIIMQRPISGVEYQMVEDNGRFLMELVFIEGDLEDEEMKTLFLLGLKEKYGQEAVRYASGS